MAINRLDRYLRTALHDSNRLRFRSRRESLVHAGSLIAAEIERLDRVATVERRKASAAVDESIDIHAPLAHADEEIGAHADEEIGDLNSPVVLQFVLKSLPTGEWNPFLFEDRYGTWHEFYGHPIYDFKGLSLMVRKTIEMDFVVFVGPFEHTSRVTKAKLDIQIMAGSRITSARQWNECELLIALANARHVGEI